MPVRALEEGRVALSEEPTDIMFFEVMRQLGCQSCARGGSVLCAAELDMWAKTASPLIYHNALARARYDKMANSPTAKTLDMSKH